MPRITWSPETEAKGSAVETHAEVDTDKLSHGCNGRRVLRYFIGFLLIPLLAGLINGAVFLFFHIMPATVCYEVLPPQNTNMITLCFIVGQYHWVAEIAVLCVLVLPCFALFYMRDSFMYKENRAKNNRRTVGLFKVLGVLLVMLVLSLIVTAPYQYMMLKACRPGEIATRLGGPPSGVVQYKDSYYLFVHDPDDEALSYTKAMDKCGRRGVAYAYEYPFGIPPRLVAIESKEEETFIVNYINEHFNTTTLWRIGGVKEPPFWDYYWDLQKYGKDEFKYFNWAEPELEQGWGNCLAIHKFDNVGYRWIKNACTKYDRQPYICEMPAQTNYTLCTWVTGSVYITGVLMLIWFGMLVYRCVSWGRNRSRGVVVVTRN